MQRSSVFRSVPWRVGFVPAEALFWIAALVGAACIDPNGESLINLCLIEQLGLPCPGDGLGTSIAYLARGQWTASWAAHPLGGPVVGVLLYHIGSLFWRARHRPPAAPSR
jgi:hypothetical protein